MIRLSWNNNGNGFTWNIMLTEKGALKGRLEVIPSRKDYLIKRVILLVPKRSMHKTIEIFSETYTVGDFSILLEAELMLLKGITTNHDISSILSELEKVKMKIDFIEKFLGDFI